MRQNQHDAYGWREVCIGEVAEVIGGGTPSTHEPSYFDGDVPWLTPKDLSGVHDRYMARGARNISRSGLQRSSAKLVPAGSVLLSTRAPVGYVALAKDSVSTNQGIRTLIPCEKLMPEYLYYWLLTNTQELERHATGSTFKELSGKALSKITLSLPPKHAQRRIIAVLGALDDKIELNHRMSETLEEAVRALFKSWFMDFDPVKDRSRYNGDLPLHCAFPTGFRDSPCGLIPAGWEIKPVRGVCATFGGATPSTKVDDYWQDGAWCWATPKDLSKLPNSVLIDTARKITDAGLRQIPSGLLPKGAVLMSSRAPIGYLAIADMPVSVNQGFIAMVPNRGVPSSYLLNWCRFHDDAILSVANGSTFLEVAKRNFRKLDVVVPTAQVMAAFDEFSEAVYRRVALNARESARLTGLRDVLLPKLLSGEIRISEAEKVVETAT